MIPIWIQAMSILQTLIILALIALLGYERRRQEEITSQLLAHHHHIGAAQAESQAEDIRSLTAALVRKDGGALAYRKPEVQPAKPGWFEGAQKVAKVSGRT